MFPFLLIPFSTESSPLNFDVNSNQQKSNDQRHHTQNMKHISAEEYRKLVDKSIELLKAEREIKKLSKIVQKKNHLIDKLTEKRKRTELSPVS